MSITRACLLAVCLNAAVVNSAVAQTDDDIFQEGGHAVAFSLTMHNPHDPVDARGLIDWDPSGAQSDVIFADANGPAGTIDTAFVQPNPGGGLPRFIAGVDLYVRSDGGVEDGFRGVSNFELRLLGSSQALIANVNPRDDGTINRYFFASPIDVRGGVVAGFTRSTAGGPRIIELDAIEVPEPAALALVAGGALLTLRRSLH